MPVYQFHVAVALTVTLVVSLVAYLASGVWEKTARKCEGDRLDVTKPEDFVDGTPIDEDGFWKRVRGRVLPGEPMC